MSTDSYICQRIAQSILCEVNPKLRSISSDALLTINLFIDEFIQILITTASSLDLLHIKSAFQRLLANSLLSRHASMEADLELSRQPLDGDQSSAQNQHPESVDQIIPFIQEACVHYCAFNNRSENASPLAQFKNEATRSIIIYITTLLEHLIEYILHSVAAVTMSDQHMSPTEHIRVKPILFVLLNDPYISILFCRMHLREKLEKRASVYSNHSTISQTTQRDHVTSPSTRCSSTSSITSYQKDFSSSTDSSILSVNEQPSSYAASTATKSSSTKSRINNFICKTRHSITNFAVALKRPLPTTVADDFDDLLESGDTKKLSLTPRRLKSIEFSRQENFADKAVLENLSPPLTPASTLSRSKHRAQSTSSRSNTEKRSYRQRPIDQTCQTSDFATLSEEEEMSIVAEWLLGSA
ncbi:MAG: hypothetical protein EXX96DRAFT_573828 [Benjaminiella poitrasii]|nr:MAG: hypothetical protein EXX96DRAFT_573828 [Benjaminiella poitrasii]